MINENEKNYKPKHRYYNNDRKYKNYDNKPLQNNENKVNQEVNTNDKISNIKTNDTIISEKIASKPEIQDIQNTIKDKNFKKPKPQNKNTKDFGYKIDSIMSVVIPLYNEEESLPELALHLEEVLNKVAGNRWEVIFVDDGSTDKSFSVLKNIHDRNFKFKAIRFRRNFGKAAALSVGFEEARGVIVITMDADLQDDPDEIPNLINKIKEGYDLVTGWKKVRHDPITKTIPSKFFNFITSLSSGLKLHDYNCGLKAYRNDVLKSIKIYGELHRYIPVLAHIEGFKVTELAVKHHSRRFGKSKYGFTRLMKGYLDLLTVLFTSRYLNRPLHFFGTIGTLFAASGFAIDLYLLIEWFLGLTFLSNRPLALFGIALIIVGVQLISMGLIGEMIAKNSIEKIKYSIKEKLK